MDRRVPDGVRHSVGPQGLRIVSETMPGVRSVALGMWIGVGSRFETAAHGGLSHFLEHMLFKGTPSRSAQEIAQAFDGLGGEINAATGRDYTVVYSRVLDEHVERAFEVMADMLQRPAMLDLEQEREVVLEEIAMYEDDPDDLVHDLAAEALFPDQPLGRPVIGTAAVIGGVSREVVTAHHARHYCAPNMVLAAAGSITHERLEALAARHLGDVTSGAGEVGVEPGRAGPPRLVIRERPTEQVHLVFSGPGISRSDDRRHAHAVLDTLMGGSMSSRLFQEVREKRGLAYSIGSYVAGYQDVGQVGVFLGTREDNVGVACEVIRRELESVADAPVGADELERAKDNVKGRIVLSLESPGTRMNRIGRSFLTDTELLSIEEQVARIEAVTPADVHALAQELWHPRGLGIAAIGPDSEAIRQAVESFSPELAAAAVAV